MTQTKLTFIRFENGIWQGQIQAVQEPAVEVLYQGETLENATLSPAENGWVLSIKVPTSALSEGVHSFVIADAFTAEQLGDFTIIAGAPAADDLRAEVALLRAELDMLKRAIRRAYRNGD
ncbi:hypothetical protein [Ruegeria sp. 6PALISEP08]|uniref:hypothetical protein n=1 Tax=Ruegeria sp. 6PALISEP08 TaxID=1225660 RepID=UPI00067F13FE|nr:hypothetical protein [Ruegeria sp. 6PALISEP08]